MATMSVATKDSVQESAQVRSNMHEFHQTNFITICFVCACVLKKTFSTEIIARWEVDNNCSVSDPKHKSTVLKKLIQKCGLSCSSMGVPTLRMHLLSLKKKRLPTCPSEVDRLLQERNEPICGACMNVNQLRQLTFVHS